MTATSCRLWLLLCAAWPCAPALSQTAWNGSPAPVPGTIQAENFDVGGEGLGYHDTTPGNAGGQYRLTEDVDITAGPSGEFVIFHYQTGEWLSYTIDVAATGNYRLELRAATSPDFPQPAYHAELDGQPLNASTVLGASGGWESYQWLGPSTVSLPAGQHRLRIVSDRQYFNLDALRLIALGDGPEMMPSSASGWTPFAPRQQTAPGTSVWQHQTGYVLNIGGNGVENVYGGWRTRITGLEGGQHYRFHARAQAQQVASLRETIAILLRWRGNFGGEVRPDYVWDFQPLPDGTLAFDRVIQAPPGTSSVDIELALQWAPAGILDFGELSFRSTTAPAARPVRTAAIYFRPTGSPNGPASVQAAADYGRQVAAQYDPDVMVFGELLNVIGTPGAMQDQAETIPGTSTQIMSALARDHGMYVVAGLLEADGAQLYNSAVLFDRDGNIAGRFRKVQLPEPDVTAGIAPGDSVPVFDTDFGRVALLVCQDISFPEPAREAALKGAELILLPIWGGKPALVQARAIENSVYVVASGYDYASDITNPLGTVLGRIQTVNGPPQVVIADLDLARRFREIHLGDWRDISNKERRTEPYFYEPL